MLLIRQLATTELIYQTTILILFILFHIMINSMGSKHAKILSQSTHGITADYWQKLLYNEFI